MSIAGATSWSDPEPGAVLAGSRIWPRTLVQLAPPLCVLLSAGLYTLACPPYEWSVAAWAVPGLLLTGTSSLRRRWALLAGLVFALVMSIGVAPWVAHATLAYFNFNRLLAGGFALAVYVVYGGIPYASLTCAYALTARRVPPTARVLLAACLWASSELLRTNIFTGLPWELLGHSQFRNLLLIQLADLGGVYAVSFVMALVSVAVAELVVDWARSAQPPRRLARRLWLPVVNLMALVLYGVHSESRLETPADASSVRRVGLVQGNVANAFRWKREYFERTLYVRWGDTWVVVATGLALLSVIMRRRPA